MTIGDICRERAIHLKELSKRMSALCPIFHEARQQNKFRIQNATSKITQPNNSGGAYLLVAREDFTACEKFLLCWRGLRRVFKSLSNYVFSRIYDMDCENLSMVAGWTSTAIWVLNTEAIISHVLQSEIEMEDQRVMELIDSRDGMQVRVRWKGLSPEDDTLEPLQRMFDDVPQLISKLLSSKNMQPDLVDRARKNPRL